MFTPTLTSYSFLLTLGIATAVLYLGWRLGVNSQLKDLVATLKTRNELLRQDNTDKDKEIHRLKSLISYMKHKKIHEKMARTHTVNSTVSPFSKNAFLDVDSPASRIVQS